MTDPCAHPGVRKTSAGYVCTSCALPLDPAQVGALPWSAREVAGLPVRGLLALAATLPPALAIMCWMPFVAWILHTLGTLCHEMGHAATALALGRPALPAFDFGQGGGVTMIGEREWWVLGLGALVAGALLQRWRGRRPLQVAVGAAVALVVLLLLTGWDQALIIAMGHGGQVLAATVFLYRALSGAAVAHAAERWLYGLVGWCLLGHAAGMCWDLLHDVGFRSWYLLGKRGIDNDLVQLADGFLGWSLEAVAWLGLLAALAAAPLAVAAHWALEGIRRRRA
jgi:hypothetical protein